MDEQSQQSTSTSIRWTRKAAVIQKRPLRLFDEDEQIDESLVDDAEVDWLTGTKRARAGALEDAKVWLLLSILKPKCKFADKSRSASKRRCSAG
jgi:hypothetical protein